MAFGGPHRLALIGYFRTTHDIDYWLDVLTAANVVSMRRKPRAPLYESGVRYQQEKRGPDGMRREEWLIVGELYRRGVGDCEDLGCARAGELQVQGERAYARAFPRRDRKPGWHIKVVRGDGSIEDPSRILGMGARAS